MIVSVSVNGIGIGIGMGILFIGNVFVIEVVIGYCY